MIINKKRQDQIDNLKRMVEGLFSDYSGVEIKEIEYSDGYHVDMTRVEFTILFDWTSKERTFNLAFDIGEMECFYEGRGEENWHKIIVDDDLDVTIFLPEERAIIWEDLFTQAI